MKKSKIDKLRKRHRKLAKQVVRGRKAHGAGHALVDLGDLDIERRGFNSGGEAGAILMNVGVVNPIRKTILYYWCMRCGCLIEATHSDNVYRYRMPGTWWTFDPTPCPGGTFDRGPKVVLRGSRYAEGVSPADPHQVPDEEPKKVKLKKRKKRKHKEKE